MFLAVDEREDNGGAAGEERPMKGARVYLPYPEDAGESAPADRPRVTLPKQTSFLDHYPTRWTWETWGKRLEHETLIIARALEAVIWGSFGALVGLAATAIPGAFVSDWSYVTWQPVGAAVGVASGALVAWRRWRRAFDTHKEMTK